MEEYLTVDELSQKTKHARQSVYNSTHKGRRQVKNIKFSIIEFFRMSFNYHVNTISYIIYCLPIVLTDFTLFFIPRGETP